MSLFDIRIKRIYDKPSADDGVRILVDRLWPRGMSKVRAAIDQWDKEIAPSPALRTWWNHDPERYKEFAERYRAELEGNPAVGALLDIARTGPITLLYAAHDPAVNHAVVLRAYLEAAAQ